METGKEGGSEVRQLRGTRGGFLSALPACRFNTKTFVWVEED